MTEARQEPRGAGANGRGLGRDIVSVFEAVAAASPDSPAVVAAGARLTYRDLNGRANRLARGLRERGVAPGAFVGLCFERSVDAVVATLAVLKIGGTYVPVDPRYPAPRVRHILGDVSAALTLTHRAVPAGVRDELVRPVLVDALDLAGDEADLGLTVAPSDPAYVMYTSGTTGRPKGAVIPHSGVVRLVTRTNYIALGPSDVVLHHSSCGFDAHTFEVWAALLNGGVLVLFEPARPDLEALGRAVAAHGVTTLLLTTALFHLAAEHTPGILRPLRWVVTGGDVFQSRAAKRVLAVCPDLRIVNGYGPTENTTFTCCFVIDRGTRLGDETPIGPPVSGTNVFVLDAARRPVPDGETGDLYTNGLGLASGYVNAPELTAEKFVPCPFPGTGPVMYQTGDRAWRDRAGNYHFVGRADGQVKVRGFRVEPGEIEAVLRERADIEEAVVVARPNAAGDRDLVAYVKPSGGGRGLDPAGVRDHLAARLPHFMVPAHVRPVSDFPLTLNGKIDRSALAAAEPVGREAGDRAGAARARYLDGLLDVWRQVLGRPALGPDDSVYACGASSLTAIMVLAAVYNRFGCSPDPAAVAAAQTPREWAAAVQDCHPSPTPEYPDDQCNDVAL